MGAAVVSPGEATPLRGPAAQAGDAGTPVGEGGIAGDRRPTGGTPGEECAEVVTVIALVGDQGPADEGQNGLIIEGRRFLARTSAPLATTARSTVA